MNLQNPVSSLMTSSLHVLSPEDKLQAAKDIFDTHNIHHIPVLDNELKLAGIVSKCDYLYFLNQSDTENEKHQQNQLRLKNYTIEEVMMKNLVTVSPDDSLAKALELLCDNRFHALPVVFDEELRGIITSHDFLFTLLHPKKQNA